MPEPTLSEIKQALADQVQDALCGTANPLIENLQVYGHMNFNPTPPSIDIYHDDPATENLAYGVGNLAFHFLVRARVTTADHEAGQELLDSMVDPRAATSLTAAIESDPTLGGVVEQATVGDVSGYGTFQAVGSTGEALMGCTWPVRVIP